MAPTSPIQPDTPIVVKITVNDEIKSHKKAKIPYSVLTDGLAALEEKVSFTALLLPSPAPMSSFLRSGH